MLEFRRSSQSGISRLRSTFSHTQDPQETLALLKEAEYWSLTTLRENLIKVGAKVMRQGR